MRPIRRIAVEIDFDWNYRHHQETLTGIQQFADEHGDWQCVLDLFAETGLSGSRAGYDGVIGRVGRSLANAARRVGVPLVNVWFNSPVARQVPTVAPDYTASARIVAEHLLARGLRRFGAFGFVRDLSTHVRIAAFQEVIAQAGASVTVCRVPVRYGESRSTWRRFNHQLEEWIDTWQPPIGIMSGSDVLARYVAEACQRKGLAVPDDVAIVGLSNELTTCTLKPPHLSSVDLNFLQVGYRAAELLEQLIRKRKPPRGPVIVEPRGLVARQSTDSRAVDDPRVAAALRFMGEHGHRPIGVDDIAKGVHVARRTLERSFQVALGRSIAEELRRMRLERLKRELIDSKTPIKSLVQRSGFGSEAQMYKIFREAEGVSPGDFRDKRRRGSW